MFYADKADFHSISVINHFWQERSVTQKEIYVKLVGTKLTSAIIDFRMIYKMFSELKIFIDIY